MKTKQEIIQELKELFGVKKNTELAEILGAKKQQVNTYTNVGKGDRVDLSRLIIIKLLDKCKESMNNSYNQKSER